MSAGEWFPRGWTCEHRHSKSYGPCEKCFNATGRCIACLAPLDDHDGLGTIDFHCGKRKAAA